MTDPVETACGPYLVLTDVTDAAPLELCRRIGAGLDAVYRDRFGLEPVGEPAGAVLLFADRSAFRRWAAETAGLRSGYAGFSRAARGLVALPADGDLLAGTLTHELTHLVNRRALGADLPPWLSEGLADAIGDAVGAGGLEDLAGIRGAEGQARRLAAAYASDRAPSLARLAARRRGEFDREVPSFDYEQSALVVRMLLLEEDLAPGFRRFLAALAGGEKYTPALLPRAVGAGWHELDRRLAAWLERQLSLL